MWAACRKPPPAKTMPMQPVLVFLSIVFGIITNLRKALRARLTQLPKNGGTAIVRERRGDNPIATNYL
jgi:hypothetical protein